MTLPLPSQSLKKKPALRAALAWICVLGAVVFAVRSFLLAFSAGYHPFSDGATFAPIRLHISGWIVVGFLLIALLQTVFLRSLKWPALIGMLSIGFAASYAALEIGKRNAPRQPDAYKEQVGAVTYAVPRQFSPSCGTLRGLCGTYCWANGNPMYRGACPKTDGMPLRVDVELAQTPITQDFSPNHGLKSLNVRHEGDQIIEFLDDTKVERFREDDLDGFFYRNDGRRRYYVDANLRIIAFVENRAGDWYTITELTEHGTLRYSAHADASPPPSAWPELSKFPRQLIESWRCDEPTCGGQFKNSENAKPLPPVNR